MQELVYQLENFVFVMFRIGLFSYVVALCCGFVARTIEAILGWDKKLQREGQKLHEKKEEDDWMMM